MTLPFLFIGTHASVHSFFFASFFPFVDHSCRMHIHHDHLDTASFFLKKKKTVAVEQLDRALLEVQNEVVFRWTKWTTSICQVMYTRVLGKAHTWFGSENSWPNWSLMKAHDGAADQQLSEDVRISVDVVSNGQLGGVQLCVVLVGLCMGRDWERSTMSRVRRRGDCIPRRTMPGWWC